MYIGLMSYWQAVLFYKAEYNSRKVTPEPFEFLFAVMKHRLFSCYGRSESESVISNG